MDILELGSSSYRLDRAREADLPALVALLADDPLGSTRETADPEPYRAAFHAIDADRDHHLLLTVRALESDGEPVVATLQLTLLPGLSRGGATRLQLEGVRVDREWRGTGLGAALLAWSHRWGWERGARLGQLTSDAARPGAHRFYESVGYVASHVGFKRDLSGAAAGRRPR
ncbi:GNAT family N-acetyltransferase [Nocardioides sp.]|uniref:GNAT family N-acetyltransferase n=1 Tax=Nocardioides sp. TaxID=35761 RepID=UPI003511CF38